VNDDYPSDKGWGRPEQPEEPLTPHRNWWQRTWDRVTAPFRSKKTTGAVPEEPLEPPKPLQFPKLLDIHVPSEDFDFETPALGDGFNFRIRVRCFWTIQATAPDEKRETEIAEVRKFIDDSRAVTRDRIEENIRPIARTFEPYRAAEAEKVLNDQLRHCIKGGDVLVTLRIWVDVTDPVREDLQKVWHNRLAWDAGGDLQKEQVRLLGELQERWEELLKAGMRDMGMEMDVDLAETRWLAPYALALAQDPNHAAKYLEGALNDRVGQTEKLLRDLLDLAVDERVEAVDFAFQTQSALLKLLAFLGVPVPALASANSDHSEIIND
jgi:hypothetical protein